MSAIHFDITGDNSNIVAAVNETTKKMEELAHVADALSQSFDMSNPEKAVESLGEAIGQYEKVIADYKDQLGELAEKQREAALAGDVDAVKEYGEQMAELANDISEASAATDALRDSLEMAQGQMEESDGIMVKLLGGQEKYKAILSQLPAPLRSVTQGLNGMVGAAKAFIATPLGAVLAAIILAYKALTTWLNKSAEGQQKLAKITGYFSGVLAGISQIAMNVGKALYNAFTNPKKAVTDLWNTIKSYFIDRIQSVGRIGMKLGEILSNAFQFKFDDAKESLKDLGNELKDFAKNSIAGKEISAVANTVKGIHDIGKAESDLNARRNALHRQQTAWMTEEAELDRQIAEERNKLRVGTDAERSAAAVRMQELINQKTARQVEMAKEEYEIKKASNALTDSSQEDLDEEQALLAKVTQLETQGVRAKGISLRIEDSMKRKAETAAKQLESLSEKRKQMAQTFADSAVDAEMRATELTILAMKDGFDKQMAELDHQHDERTRALEKNYQDTVDAVRKIQKEEYEKKNGTTSGFVFDESDTLYLQAKAKYQRDTENEERQYGLERANIEKEILETRQMNRLAYLKNYGTYKEKELAITEEYDKKIAEADDEYVKASLIREKSDALFELQKAYSTTFALIYADAKSLSDDYLGQAISATQEEIRKATESGDIQRLTDLYGRLKEQLEVQTDRSRGWGFSGLSSAFKQLAEARDKRQLSQVFSSMESNEFVDFQKEGAEMFAESIAEEEQAIKAIKKAVGEITSAFGELGSTMEEMGGTIGEIGGLLSGLSSNAKDVETAFDSTASKGDKIAVAVSGTIQLISMLAGAINANKEAQEEWNRTIEQSAHKLRMLELEALDYKKQNIFSVENPYKKAIDGALQYSEAMKTLGESISKLNEGQVQTGTKKAVDWKNVGQGATLGVAIGASIGSVIPAIGNAVGAIVGGAIGTIVGLFSTKTVPVFEGLAEKYGELFDENYKLNPQLVADYDKLDEATKHIVDNWEEIRKKAEEAEAQMRENFSNLAGDIGSQLSDALVNAFRNGELFSAIDEFHKKMTDTIEDILSQLVFSATFGAMFDQLEDRMMKSFSVGGDQDIVDDLIWMEGEYQNSLDQYNAAMSQVQDSLRRLGYDVFAPESAAQNATAGGFATMSQDTANELNGRFTALQLSNENISQAAREGLLHIISIGEMVSSGSATLAEIRNLHMLELGYLEDIAKFTKPLLDFGDKLDKIKQNTDRL